MANNPAAITIRGHQPEICLAGAGFELQGQPVLRHFKVGGIEYPFRRYQFKRQGKDVVVYFGVWSSDGSTGALQDRSDIYRTERVLRAWRGEGNRGRRLIEVGFWDASLSEAEREMSAFVRRTMLPAMRQSLKESSYAIR